MNLIKRHEPVFQEGLGTIKDLKATLQCKLDVSPRFFKYRSVPHAMHAAVEKELDRLEDSGIIVPVQHSDWATPIVPVPKSDGSIWICGDFQLTVNAATNLEVYPLPRIEDIFASLSGGKQFSKLDLAQAYLQLPLAEESSHLSLSTPTRVCIGTSGYLLGSPLPLRFSSVRWKHCYRASPMSPCISMIYSSRVFQQPTTCKIWIRFSSDWKMPE